MTTHKRKCVCGHMLDVEEVYQLGMKDALRKNLLKDCESCKASMIPQIRADAIDEFRMALHQKYNNNKYLYENNGMEYWNLDMEEVDEIANQLKGAENDSK